jgi:hypothetical protein
MEFLYCDGGRSNYFEGVVGDCVTRAFSIALGKNYLTIYEIVNKVCGSMPTKRARANWGVYPNQIKRIGKHFNLKFNRKKGIVNKKTNGKYIFFLDGHLTCAMNGILMDTIDCRNSKYYGYYEL